MSKNIILATIYKLVFKDNTDIAYVGQSTNINSRFKQHVKNAKDFSNIDNKLYFFMNLYGIHNFYIEVIEIFNNISQFELNNNEKKYIQLFGSINTTFSNSNISIPITSSLIQQLLTKLQNDNIPDNVIKQISNSLYNKYSITTLDSSNNTIQTLYLNQNTTTPPKPTKNPTTPYSNQLTNTYNMTDTNTDSVALKKLRNAEYQRKYRAKLTQQQLIALNSSKASTNRNRYNTDPNYKFNKNLYNKNKAKDNRNKAKLYDSIINSTQPSTDTTQDVIQPSVDTIQPSTDTTQDAIQPSADATQPSADSTLIAQDAIQPSTDATQSSTDATQSSTDSTQSSTDSTQPSTDATQPSTLHSKHIFCVYCNQSYNKYYFSKHLTSKKHINNYTS